LLLRSNPRPLPGYPLPVRLVGRTPGTDTIFPSGGGRMVKAS
jgi:hypothetical protein